MVSPEIGAGPLSPRNLLDRRERVIHPCSSSRPDVSPITLSAISRVPEAAADLLGAQSEPRARDASARPCVNPSCKHAHCSSLIGFGGLRRELSRVPCYLS